MVNVAVFAWQLSIDGWGHVGMISAQRGGAIPYEILTFEDVNYRALVPPPLTVLTSMFLHGGLVHLASNLLFLWVFGNAVEDALGKARFAAFYLASGVVAALVQVVATSATASSPLALEVPMIGASGAIAGVLAAYLLLFPRARVLTVLVVLRPVFLRLVHVPASVFLGLWFLVQLLAVLLGGAPGVAVFAHLGGFVAGLVLVRVLGRRRGWRASRVAA